MPDLLILAKDNKDSFELQDVAEQQGYRIKLTFDPILAQEWLKFKEFHAVLVDYAFGYEMQQKIADLLWAKSPLAPIIFYDLNKNAVVDSKQVRLFGADIAYGEKAIPHIERLLSRTVENFKHFTKDSLKIMVVEDLDAPRDIICTYLEGLGYSSPQGFSSAQAAIDELESQPDKYKCILTDIRMPHIDGKKLIEMIRSRSSLAKIPVIVLTAHGTSECLVDCMRAGASGFLVKPPKKADMVRELARASRIIAGHEEARMVTEKEIDGLVAILNEKGIL